MRLSSATPGAAPYFVMQNPSRAFLLGPLLKGVSRSFYLTLNVLPAGMRDPVGVAYLLARAADTIADTALIPPGQRLDLLLSLRACVNGTASARDDAVRRIAGEVANQQAQSDEKVLLESIGAALDVLTQLADADQAAIREIVTTLTEGMEYDLRTFPDERSGSVIALRTWDDLDRYTYLVAGCVGEFWTKMTYAHVPRALKGDEATLMRNGVRFGKALQMVNVLRDCGRDLRIGRCYLPETMLHQAGLRAEDLLAPDASQRARALMFDLVRRSLDHFRAAIDYTFAIPAWSLRLRLACLWPILIGLETLLLLVDNENWLDPHQASKLKRGDVYRILLRSTLAAPSNWLLRTWFDGLLARIEARVAR